MFMVVIILTSTSFSFWPPILLILPSCRTLKSLACKARSIELISSSKIVPPSAISKRPGLLFAPVKLPFSVPKRRDSNKSFGKAAQFCAINSWFFRREALCILWAKSSLPVPVSPYINTDESLLAHFIASLTELLNLGFWPIISANSKLVLLSTSFLLSVELLLSFNLFLKLVISSTNSSVWVISFDISTAPLLSSANLIGKVWLIVVILLPL